MSIKRDLERSLRQHLEREARRWRPTQSPPDLTGLSYNPEPEEPPRINARKPTMSAEEFLGHPPGPRDVGRLLAYGFFGDDGWFDSSKERRERQEKAEQERLRKMDPTGLSG